MRMFVLTLLLFSLITGCGRLNGNASNPSRQGNAGEVRVQQAAPKAASSRQDLQTRLENLAKSIPQVKDAKCVLLGKTAIVGITVDPRLERSKVSTIKYSVAEAFRKDPEGINAFVTADMGLGERIRNVRDDIREGRPFSGFAQELGDIIGRVAPQLPRDIQPMDNGRTPGVDTKQMKNNNL